MLWFQKKEKELLPDLSDKELPRLPEFEYNEPSEEKEILPSLRVSSIPSIPESSNQAIKQEISSFSSQSIQDKWDLFSNKVDKPIVAEPTEMIEETPRTIELVEKPILKPTIKKIEPVYVRLDKFKESLEILIDIKNKIADIENLLDKIKNIRQKEKKELDDWEREIQILKARIETIDSNLFKKLD